MCVCVCECVYVCVPRNACPYTAMRSSSPESPDKLSLSNTTIWPPESMFVKWMINLATQISQQGS